jgi:hypothetical protein
MLAFPLPGFTLSRLWLTLTLSDFVSNVAFSLTYAATVATAKLEAWQINTRKRNADQLLALATNKLTISNEASQLLLDFASYNFSESV